jgi:hypothetical protein
LVIKFGYILLYITTDDRASEPEIRRAFAQV